MLLYILEQICINIWNRDEDFKTKLGDSSKRWLENEFKMEFLVPIEWITLKNFICIR